MRNLTVASIDDGIGPFFEIPGRNVFDFTLLFEDTILSLLPSAILLSIAPVRIAQLWQSSQKVAASKLRNVKIAVLAVFLALQVANLVAWSISPRVQTRASVAAASLSLVVACAISALSYLEHTRCIQPSSVISAYLLVTVFMDAVKVRTLWLRGGSSPIAAISSSLLAVKLLILMVEAREKRNILLSPYTDLPPESTSGLFSRSLFWWLNPMFLLGYRSVLRDIDLFPTDDDLSSETLRLKFQKHWLRRRSPARRYELIIKMTRCMLGPLAMPVIPRISYTFFRYMQPFLIKRATKFISQPESDFVTNEGWGLTAAYGIVFTGVAITVAMYHHKAFRFTTMVRGALVTTIYAKTMDLSITGLDEDAAVTLMSTDVAQICDALPLVHELWASTIELGLTIWLLYSEVGLAMLGPLFVTIVCIGGTFAISSRSGGAQKEWLASLQTRVDVTSKAIRSMKGVKMLGLTTTLDEIIRRLRNLEIGSSLRSRRLRVWSLIAGNSADVYAPGSAFAVFVIIAHYNGQTLNVSSAYTALSLIQLLSAPIGTLAFCVPRLTGAMGCFDRIQEYLLSTARHDHRLMFQGSSTVQTSSVNDDRISKSADIELREIIPSKLHNANNSARKALMEVRNLTISWNDAENPVVDDVSFDLLPGLTMIVGPIGSGKSSLLKGLLGELPSSKGYVYTDTLQIAYVGQTPWIQTGSIRDNIIGISNFEAGFYSNVIRACALENDLETLPQGDHTQVGSSGTGLSGGQKLRLALARAVYSRRRIIILDDVFSGVDAASEDRIFSRLLGRTGLLRGLGTAVLLVTHAAHRLSYADNIIALDPSGSIHEQGAFSELMNARGYVSSLAARHTVEEDDTQNEAVESISKTLVPDLAKANAADDVDRSVGDLTIYKYYFSAIGYGAFAFLLLLEVICTVCMLLPDLLVNFWTSAIELHGNSVNGLYLGIYLSVETITFITLTWMSFHLFASMVPNSARVLHSRLLSTLNSAPLFFFTSTDIGQVINRFSQDLNVIDFELPQALFGFLIGLFITVVQSALISISAKYFAAIMPFVYGLLYFVQKFYLRTSRQIRLMDLEAKAPLYLNFIESLDGLSTIRAFGWTQNFEERNRKLLDQSQRPFYLLFCIQRWLNLVLDLTIAGLAVLLMALVVVLRTRLEAGLVGLALLQIMGFSSTLTQIIRFWTQLETSLGAVTRIKKFVQETESEHLPKERNSVPDAWPSQGAISFDHVSAAYTAEGPSVLKSINLDIPAGQKLGLVGRSGSGKSSFITTLFHMLEITGGGVSIDHIDLSTVPREEVRRRLNVIPQDPVFIAGTIRENLDPFAREKGDQPLISVLNTVGLWSIVSHAGGLDVQMDPENLLSHGQRQLFCLARAILNKKQSKILILDEATASVDIQTDETMQRIIRSEFGECTVIAIAHRLGTIVDFDRVVVLDKGKIVEDGDPQILLRNRESWFRHLWDS